ncbi:L-threonylcarbamoyladenylate synthase [Proteiniclasticum sp. C24MP]|uniref:L-threonylcarbamoyladenylate synthase n=1 Tax=Proteiniclasticum sp. C24MP TaxID=3374101 RepID=UPI003754941C
METIKVNFENRIDMEWIEQGAEIIKRGGVVAFPTETVYGLGADALNQDAVKKIFEAKGRPQDNPLIIHVADADLSAFAQEIPGKAQELMDKFWPGPLTLILKKTDLIPMETSAGLDTVGIRMPSNETAMLLIRASGCPIAAPSANISGKPSPTNFRRCVEDLDGRVDMIIGDGSSIVGLESTIVDYSVHPPRLLRPGYITYDDLLTVDHEIVYDEAMTRADEKEIPKAPGMKYRHYAPKAPLTIITGNEGKVEKRILALAENYQNQGKVVGVLAPKEREKMYNKENIRFISLGSEKNSSEIARNLFEGLRTFDDLNVDVILAEGFSEKGVGVAIMNRLKKASGFNIIEV